MDISMLRLDVARVHALVKLPRRFWTEVQVPGTDAPFHVSAICTPAVDSRFTSSHVSPFNQYTTALHLDCGKSFPRLSSKMVQDCTREGLLYAADNQNSTGTCGVAKCEPALVPGGPRRHVCLPVCDCFLCLYRPELAHLTYTVARLLFLPTSSIWPLPDTPRVKPDFLSCPPVYAT